MEYLIKDTTELVFELKGTIPDGQYVKLMDNLKEMYKLKDKLTRREKIARKTVDILKAWIHNEKGATYSGSLSTHDGNLFSYSSLIGCTNADGKKCIVNLTASGSGFVSYTTSRHVGKCIQYCTQNQHEYEIITLEDF